MTLLPNEIGPFDKGKDWAHVDQTVRKGPLYCIQGQAVLTNTTASFRCTPGSCNYYEDILDLEGVKKDDKSNWCKFKDPSLVKAFCEEKKLEYQIPIKSSKGSFIVWSSTTIHSAKLADGPEKPDKKDPWKGWRGAVYVCYRPREELKPAALKRRTEYVDRNRNTSHWGETLMAKTPGGRYLYIQPRAPIIEDVMHDPELIFSLVGKPIMDKTLI
jgi:hypothetical protein